MFEMSENILVRRSEFFNLLRVSKSKLLIQQEEEKGYSISFDIDNDRIFYMYKNDRRFFKSVDIIINALRVRKIYTANITFAATEIEKKEYVPKEIVPATGLPPKKRGRKPKEKTETV